MVDSLSYKNYLVHMRDHFPWAQLIITGGQQVAPNNHTHFFLSVFSGVQNQSELLLVMQTVSSVTEICSGPTVRMKHETSVCCSFCCFV